MSFRSQANIHNNARLREPQRDGWAAIQQHFANPDAEREAGIVLPVGCGKSGLIAVTPFATQSHRVLVIAPGLRIKEQLLSDLSPASEDNFYERFSVTNWPDGPIEVASVEGQRTNLDDLEYANVVVANIQQLQGEENRWLAALPEDFFDLILFDEGHHNTAESWARILERFPRARVVSYSATPRRADGQIMAGRILYSYPVVRAIAAGYVKRLSAKMLNPGHLTYIDPNSGAERTITAADVRRLGSEDAAFRRGIIMSDETLGAIVDVSINELNRLRRQTGERNLKIIASAISQQHCIQIVQAFRDRGMRADYVHSREGQPANDRVFAALENNQLDAIVQARMLGEGFDHPLLAVAMVGNIFANLSPFVQFVGRVMRSLDSGNPLSPRNEGVVVFHAGANIAERWNDFREFSEADQAYFAELLPLEEAVDFSDNDLIDQVPGIGGINPIEVIGAEQNAVEDLTLTDDPEIRRLFDQLAAHGVSPEQAAAELRRRPLQRQNRRRAAREALPDLVNNGVGRILAERRINPGGRTLDPRHLRTNFVFAAAEVNRRLARLVGRELGDRSNWTLEDHERAMDELDAVLAEFSQEIGNG